MGLCKTVAILLLVFCVAEGRCRKYYRSCKDLKTAKPHAKSGEYIMRNGRGQPYRAYCEFHCHYGYMFISRSTRDAIAMRLIKASRSEVLVRHLRSNGKQFDTTMRQLSRYANLPLSIQYNTYTGYNPPVNRNTMGPYMYLGFLPRSVAGQRSVQGYNANGRDYTFHNCDSNPNSYLAFFFNPNNAGPNGYYKRCCYTALMRNWIAIGYPSSYNLPGDYFFQFEMHMGGCGGYAINGYNTLIDITGAAMGLRFDIPRRDTFEASDASCN